MNINGGPSALGLQHMAARAQEVRKQFTPTSETPTSDSGNNVASSGEILPQAAEQSPSKPDHATGLERAIEQLQQNAAKSPEAKGLQQALEMLMRNQERTSTIDVQA